MIVIASGLNVRTGPAEEHLQIGKLANGAVVSVLDAAGDWVWVEPPGGWVARRYLKADAALSAPTGLAGIKEVFGEPGAPACSAGRVHLPAPLKLGWENASVTVVRCHILMQPIFESVFREIYDAGDWELIETFDGLYEDRVVKGKKKRSTHAWGISADLNAATNRVGTAGNMPARITGPFERHGFLSGGKFTRPDPMHLQFAAGY